MADDMASIATVTESVIQQLEALGVTNLNASKKMGILEKQQLKLTTALKKNPIMGIVSSLAGMAKAVSNVSKSAGNHSAMTKKQNEELNESMTAFQKLTAGMLFFGGVGKMNNKILSKTNNIFTRLATRVFSLLSIFLIVGFALAALAIAFEGANSPLLTFTDDMGFVHDAMQGLVLVLTGEGDEDGLAALFDILAISVLAAAAAFVVLNGSAALVIGALVAVAGTYQLVKNETDNTVIATMAAIAVFMVLVGTILIVKGVMAAMAAGTAIAITGTVGAILAGIGLIVGGVAMLWAFIQGTGNTFIDWVIGIVGTLLLYGGLVLIFGATIPVAIVAGLVFIVAIVIKYWEQIKAFFVGIFDFLFDWGATIFYGALAGLGMLFGGIVALITGAIGLVVGLIVGVFTMLFDLGASFARDVIFGGGSLIDWFVSIPSVLWNGFKRGFKMVFNGVMGIYNDFAELMKFDIPDWVPVVGGKTFQLPKVPMLAKGGIVNSPTLAMIGEDGPEAVVPLSRKNNPQGIGLGGGGGVTVNINVGGVTDRTDKKQLAKEIGDLIRAEMARSGRSGGNRRSAV